MISEKCLRDVVTKLFLWVFICCRIWYQLLDQVAHLLEGWLPQKTRKRMQWNMDFLPPTLLIQFAYPGIDIFPFISNFFSWFLEAKMGLVWFASNYIPLLSGFFQVLYYSHAMWVMRWLTPIWWVSTSLLLLFTPLNCIGSYFEWLENCYDHFEEKHCLTWMAWTMT